MLEKNLSLLRHNIAVVWKNPKSLLIYPGQMSRKAKFQWVVLGSLAFLLSQRELSFQLSLSVPEVLETGQAELPPTTARPQLAAIQAVAKPWWKQIKEKSKDIRDKLNLANAATAVGAALSTEQQAEAAKYSNLGFVLNPTLPKRLGVSAEVVAFKTKKCTDYVDKYAKIAVEEMELYGIPASITLAQGLLESNAGDSRLAKNENNHFGIKCKKKCLGCRCANYTDDDKYDMFRIFESPWYSFREHSKLLQGKRYKHLLKLEITDYKNWARGLQSAGYATNPKYGVTLIEIIEKLNLQRFDKAAN